MKSLTLKRVQRIFRYHHLTLKRRCVGVLRRMTLKQREQLSRIFHTLGLGTLLPVITGLVDDKFHWFLRLLFGIVLAILFFCFLYISVVVLADFENKIGEKK